jgi:hypothetical protein
MIGQYRTWHGSERPGAVVTLARAFSLAALGLAGCNASEPDSPSPPSPIPTPFHAVRAVVNCLNSVGVELDVGGRPVYLSIRYSNEQVFIVGKNPGAEQQRERFDRVYTSCGVDIEDGLPVPGLKERFERVFPGHPVATALAIREGTLHVRTEDKYMFFVTAKGADTGAAMDAFLGLLPSREPLGEGYYVACPTA